jgi:putative DNA primase/helicase
MQTWLLELRRRGISVLLVDHAGKNGTNRGTSKKQDILDIVLSLEKPNDYTAGDGARFEVHFKKSRGICGKDVNQFEAQLTALEDGELIWRSSNIIPTITREAESIKQLSQKGLSCREIAERTGISKSKIAQLLKQ